MILHPMIKCIWAGNVMNYQAFPSGHATVSTGYGMRGRSMLHKSASLLLLKRKIVITTHR